MTIWAKNNLEAEIRDILVNICSGKNHHFDNPYMTAYQIAIELDKNLNIIEKLNNGKTDELWTIGGIHTGLNHEPFARYIAKTLSSYIKTKKIVDIEGAFLATNTISEIKFAQKRNQVISAVTSNSELSMFRIKK